MTDDRAIILERLGTSLGAIPERAPYPEFPADVATPEALRSGGLDAFAERLEAVNTRVLRHPRELPGLLARSEAKLGYCDPELAGLVTPWLDGDVELDLVFDRDRVDEYTFGITRATGGIVETGSLVLTDRDTSDRLGAVAPWTHIACLNPRDLYQSLAAAISALRDDPNTILVTGHSQTADVEGILIHGVHGPGEQVCLLYDPGPPDEQGEAES